MKTLEEWSMVNVRLVVDCLATLLNFNLFVVVLGVSGKKNSGSYCIQMTWGCWQRQKLQRRAVEWQESLDRKGLKERRSRGMHMRS